MLIELRPVCKKAESYRVLLLLYIYRRFYERPRNSARRRRNGLEMARVPARRDPARRFSLRDLCANNIRKGKRDSSHSSLVLYTLFYILKAALLLLLLSAPRRLLTVIRQWCMGHWCFRMECSVAKDIWLHTGIRNSISLLLYIVTLSLTIGDQVTPKPSFLSLCILTITYCFDYVFIHLFICI